jgi:hypothetical protein
VDPPPDSKKKTTMAVQYQPGSAAWLLDTSVEPPQERWLTPMEADAVDALLDLCDVETDVDEQFYFVLVTGERLIVPRAFKEGLWAWRGLRYDYASHAKVFTPRGKAPRCPTTLL